MEQAWLLDLIEWLPQGRMSRAWGWLARRRRPRMGVELLKRAFVEATGIDMTEAGSPLSQYETLQELFVRKLRPGIRRIDGAPEGVVSPVDGTCGMSGIVRDGLLFQIKGRQYSAEELLDDSNDAARFEGGSYATFYLAPHNYHRIHSPVAGYVKEAVLIPGALRPVFPAAVQQVDGLFCRNERLITYLDLEGTGNSKNTETGGRVAVIKVGATLVGRISVTYDATARTNRKKQSRRRVCYDPPHRMNKGEELGAFELGSTVVLLAEPGHLSLDLVQEGQPVYVGQRIGTLTARRSKTKKVQKKKTRRATPARGAKKRASRARSPSRDSSG